MSTTTRERRRSVSTLDGYQGGHSRPASVASNYTVGYGEDGQPDKRKKKGAIESYVFVKPPSAGGKNALNIQVQLVAGGASRVRGASESSNMSAATVNFSSTQQSSSLHAPPPNKRRATSPSGSQISLHSAASTVNHDDSAPSNVEELRDSADESASKVSSDEPPEEGIKRSSIGRSPSIRSTRSSRSVASTSGESKAPSTTGSRRIVPLYNLEFHSVLTTVITDAGTDVKVAKFMKRGVDVIGVGHLEPTEWWPTVSPSSPPVPTTPLPASPTSSSHDYPIELDRELTPLSETANEQLASKPLGSSTGVVDVNPKKLFNRFFRKKESDAGGSLTNLTGSQGSPSGAGAGMMEGLKATLSNVAQLPTSPSKSVTVPGRPGGHAKSASVSTITGASVPPGMSGSYIGLPTLGMAPIVRPLKPLPATPPLGVRPSCYYWTVSRWAVRGGDGFNFSSLVETFNINSGAVGSTGSGENEVRFEWVRGRKKGATDSPKKMRRSSISFVAPRKLSTASDGSSVLPLAALTESSNANGSSSGRPRTSRSRSRGPTDGLMAGSSDFHLPPSPNRSRSSLTLSSNQLESPRPSTDSRPSPSPEPRHAGLPAEDEVEDPEDSEVPWFFSIVIGGITGKRISIGTLSPAPHHPRVVAQLKVPFPLPAVKLPSIPLPSNTLGIPFANLLSTTPTNNSAHSTSSSTTQPVAHRDMDTLTPEQLKDVCFVTGIWLLVREDFAGLGKAAKAAKPAAGWKK